MKNPTGNKLEKLVFRIFDQMVEGADKYVTKQGSTWLIFTESKKWIIEFTKDKTLWFNYNLFQNELDLIGKDCTEERDLIKDWFESRFLNKPKVWATFNHAIDSNQAVEDTIQNGVKEAHHVDVMKFFDKKMENTIENGVKDTKLNNRILDLKVEDTIQEGVKYTQYANGSAFGVVEDTIQEGVKHTEDTVHISKETVEDTIQNGVKHTIDIEFRNKFIIEDTIQNGVKETQTRMWPPVGAVEDTIQNGVKDVRTPGVGDLESTMEFMNENNTLDVQKLLDDVIENGVKEAKEDRLFRTIRVMNTIKNGVKETKESMLESLEQIDHQVTNCEITENINDAIENGVKETKEISNISLMSEIFKVKAKQTIRDGVKALKAWKSNRCEDHGYFELVDGIPTYTPMIQVKDVLENGVKEIQPLPAQDGNRDWGLYYHRQEDRTKPHTEYVKEVIEDSYNHRGRVEGVIRNTDKDGI
jgi:hypothetical protein